MFGVATMVNYWLKIIQQGDPILADPTNSTGMSWDSIKRVRCLSPIEGQSFSSFNAHPDAGIGHVPDRGDPIFLNIIRVPTGVNLIQGVINHIEWGKTGGLPWANLVGNDWENNFFINDLRPLGHMNWGDHQNNIRFLQNFKKVGFAFKTGMWLIPPEDFEYIVEHVH